MKAVSPEWHATSSRRRHALPPLLPLSPASTKSSARTPSRLHSNDFVFISTSSHDNASSFSSSKEKRTNSNQTNTTSFSTSERGSSGSGRGESGSESYSYGERRRRKNLQFPPSFPSSSSSLFYYPGTRGDDNIEEYKGQRLFYPSQHSTFSYDNSKRSNRSSRGVSSFLLSEAENLSDRRSSRLSESEFGATSTASEVTEESEEDDQNEEENDENVYESFKESLMMLKRPQHTEFHHHFKSPSLSPAISMRSVITELDEEDEENLPPEQVEEEIQSTSETEDDEDQSFYSHVPKSPVKVRVKVEKTPDRDDKVKVTVRFEDEYGSASTSTGTAETVRWRENENISSEESETEEDEEDDDKSEQSDSEENSLSEEEEVDDEEENDEGEEEANTHENKTDCESHKILNTSTSTSTTTTTSGPSSTSHSTSITTATESQSQSREDKSENSSTEKSRSEEETSRSSSDHTHTTSNSSRSHSATSSPLTRQRNLYLAGSKTRSLSARMQVASPLTTTLFPLRQRTFTLPSPHDDKTPHYSTFTPKKLSRFATYTLQDRERNLPSSGDDQVPLPEIRSHSATSYTRSRQFATALSQITEKSRRPTPSKDERDSDKLPPINSSSFSSSSGSFPPKPRPLLRNLTYTICGNSNSDENATVSIDEEMTEDSQATEFSILRRLSELESQRELEPIDLSQQRRLSEIKHSVDRFPSEVEDMHLLYSEQTPFDSIYSIGNQRYNDIIALTKVNMEPQESIIFPPLKWKDSRHDPGSESMLPQESFWGKSRESSESVTASASAASLSSAEKAKERKKENLINREFMTYNELMQESVDEPQTTQSRLKKFALQKIRKQIEKERKRIQSMELEGSCCFDSDEDEDDDEDDDDDELSDEEMNSDKKRALIFKKKFNDVDDTHIPMPATSAIEEEDHYISELLGPPQPTQGEPEIVINPSDGSSWGQDMKRDFDDEAEPKTEPTEISPLGTRPNTAESGYKALPPSRVSSLVSSRQQSVDVDELEKEKDRLLEEWKKSGATGPPPTAASVAGSTSSLHHTHPNISYHINSEHTSVYGSIFQGDLRDSEHDALIKGDIDLTKELPGEEKKIAFIWEEFNRDEREGGGMVDYEFSTLLDEMVMDVNSYKPQANTNSSHSLQVSNQGIPVPSPFEAPQFDPSRKYQTLSEMISLLSHNLRLVSSETLEDHMASLISLVSSVLKKVRKNRTEDDYLTQISCLSTIRVLCDRIQEMQSSQNLKYADLSWLFRILCKYSSDANSKIRPEASFCLARLVKVAGPTLVVRPIYFILVMESESGGSGKTTTGAKTKSAAIDTLTYALLSFPRENFHNLEEIAGWVCLAMLNEERRIRQSALECLAVIAKHLGGRDKALPLFHTLFLKEELDHFSRSPSPDSIKTTRTGKSGKSGKGTNRSDPIPFSVGGTVRLLTGPGFPIAQPIDAITARVEKDVYPVPSTKGLIEYAVNVPTGKDLVLLMTQMLDKDDDEWDFSSSTDSLDSAKSNMSKRSSVTSIGYSDIDWSGEGKQNDKKKGDEDVLISPDVAYILMGKGRVNKQEVVLLDTYKREIIPEILEMLSRKQQQKEGKGKNKKRWGKPNKKRKRRRRKGKRNGGSDDDDDDIIGRRRPGQGIIPTFSFDANDEDQTLEDTTNSGQNQLPDEEEAEKEIDESLEGGPKVVIDPPVEEGAEASISVKTAGDSTNKS